MEVLAKAITMILLKYKNVSNQQAVYLKLTQYYI